ncbi:MAG: carbohydrate binding family 9 domain-containing protein [Verrucomicrobia bacterium]|nr:carbohydrate binding family 9 domain-containing protein [Verrucomicrobiota bacterium]
MTLLRFLLLVCCGAASLAGSPLPGVAARAATVPPKIDGLLDDAVWGDAPQLGEFTQVEPREGARPTQRTEVRVLFDRDHLYFAIRCFDSEPGRIRAPQMERDGNLDGDDYVAIALDSFGRKRDGYLFRVNPNGVKVDGLIERDGLVRLEWDTIWQAAARRDDLGWTAELAIPVKSLSFDPAQRTWGLNVERVLRRSQETSRWASPSRNLGVTTLGGFGELRGLEGLVQGLGLTVKPFASWRSSLRPGEDVRAQANFGLDVVYQITPSLTATLTVRTDFADAEVDERRVNLTRFSLFFPEKRDFFLQDASLFSFGGIRQYPLPFFSRRIGLGPNGEVIDILAGLKLTGRIGDLSVGFLNVQTEAAAGIASKNLTVFRPALQIWGESSVGAIVTVGDPRGPGRNVTAGVDLNFLNSKFLGEGQLSGHAFFMRSWSSPKPVGDPFATAISLNLDLQPWTAYVYASNIGRGFDPALGFTPIVGARELAAYVSRRFTLPRGGRYLYVELDPYALTDTSFRVLSWNLVLPRLVWQSHAGDEFALSYAHVREQLFAPFEIARGVVVAPGDYQFHRLVGRFSSSSARPLSLRLEGSAGQYYDGTSWRLRSEVVWRPSRHFSLTAAYDYQPVHLSAGSFRVRILSIRLGVAFSATLSWTTLAQYDSFSRQFGLNSRLRWIVRPGSEIFLVANQGFEVLGDRFRGTTTEVNMKAGWTFRF